MSGSADQAKVAAVGVLLSAYDWRIVKEAIKGLNHDRVRGDRENTDRMLRELRDVGWIEHEGQVPEGFEWRQIGEKVLVRDPALAVQDPGRTTVRGTGTSTRRTERKKTDTSVKRVADLKCPACGGEFFKEPICPGCEEGRKGFKIRLLCGECDYVLSL